MFYNFNPSGSNHNADVNSFQRPVVESFWFETLQSGKRQPYGCGKICQADRQEIYHWSPKYTEILGGTNAINISFHPLPSGHYCLSRTCFSSDFLSALHSVNPSNPSWNGQITDVSSADELMSLGHRTTMEMPKVRLFTLAWVIPVETFRLFSSHALTLYRSLKTEAIGCQVTPDGQIEGRSVTPSQTVKSILKTLARRRRLPFPNGEFDALLKQDCSMIIYGKANLISWFDDRLTAMSVQERENTTFCTSLKFSPARPFLMTGIGASQKELRRIGQKFSLPVWDVRKRNAKSTDVVKPFKDDELIKLWECLKGSLWGDRDKYAQGIQLWREYRNHHKATAESALASLLQWSLDAYRGLDAMQFKQTQQVHAMIDMLDELLKS